MPLTTRLEGTSPESPMPQALTTASTNAEVVRIPARKVLAIDGTGAPESREFEAAIQALYAVAYTLKFALKRADRDFKVGALEGKWWVLAGAKLAPRRSWRWQLRIAVPASVHAIEAVAAIRAVSLKKAEAVHVHLLRLPAQTAGRILHVGPYAEEGRSLEAIREALRREDLAPAGPHIEVYLSDPRRVDPSRLRTMLLLET